jgi:hypothetical protein
LGGQSLGLEEIMRKEFELRFWEVESFVSVLKKQKGNSWIEEETKRMLHK